MTTSNLSSLGDEVLMSSLSALVRASNSLDAELIEHLAEVDARGLYRERGYPSLFAFCQAALNFSEDVAYNRIEVARAARRFPQIVDELRSGTIHVTGLRMLSRHLSDENCAAVLSRARGLSKRQIEELVAELAPKPDVPDSIRRLPVRASSENAQAPAATSCDSLFDAPVSVPSNDVPPTVTLTSPVSRVEPLSPEAFKIQFTASRALRDKLNEARDLLRHANPEGDIASTIERALDLLIEKVKKDRFAVVDKPRQPARPQKPGSRNIPAAVRREVYKRDEGRCTFETSDGHRCNERGRLEFDHIEGFARTREHSVEKIRLRCRAHNQLAAEQMPRFKGSSQHCWIDALAEIR
jgi:hypothetical protein